MTNPGGDGYHDLLPLHHAMQLRKRILTQGRSASSGRADEAGAYDGRADQDLITRQLELILPFDRVTGHLYRVLFEERPQLRLMFPENIDFQQDRLTKAFMYLIENLHRPDVVVPAFERLGSEHRKLGVRPAHYKTFVYALREALRISGGQLWTAELEAAWMRVTEFAIGLMVKGAEAAIAEPPYWNAEVVAHERRARDLAVIRAVASEPFPHLAGQYASVQSKLLPRAWRPYWIACPPRDDGLLEFHVRMTGPGGMSDALVRGTKIGDTLRVGPASGVMTASEDRPERDLLLVAIDTGLAPIKAILEDLGTRWRERRRAHLFVAGRHRADLYDWDALTEFESRHGWLKVIPVVTQEQGFGEETDPDPLADALDRFGDWSAHVAFVGGPPRPVNATIDGLLRRNMPRELIRYEPPARQSTVPAPAPQL